MPARTLELEFPLGGLDRKLAYQKQRPYTTPSVQNVRPEGTLEGRVRGGSRPGMVKTFAQRVGQVSGTAVGLPTDVENSVLTATAAIFSYIHVGSTVTFDTSGYSYPIRSFTSTTVVVLTGNANDEASGDTFKVHTPIRMLSVMRSLGSAGETTFTEEFNAGILDDTNYYDAPSWDVAIIGTANGQGVIAAAQDRGCIVKSTAGAPGEKVSTTAPYSVEVEWHTHDLAISAAEHTSAKCRMFAKLDNTTPAEDEGVIAQVEYILSTLTTTDTVYSAFLTIHVDGSQVIQRTILPPGSTRKLKQGVLKLTIDGDIATASWVGFDEDVDLFQTTSYDVSGTTSTGKRVGWDKTNTGDDAGSVFCDNFKLEYITTDGGTPLEATIASANGELWRETVDGTLAKVTLTGMTLNSTVPLMAVDRLGKLYIADYGDARVENVEASPSAAIADGVLDDSDVADWTDLNIEIAGDVVEVSNVVNGAGELATRTIFHIQTGGIHATNGLSLKIPGGANLDSDDDCDSCNFRVVRGAKVYDVATDTLSLWTATDGAVPANCSIIEHFNSRIVMGGDEDNSGWWFMSRYNDPNDWDYGASATDKGRAVPGNATNSDAGELALPLSAIVSTGEDYAVFSAESEMYLLRGDPNVGGIMGNVSRQIGIGAAFAYCQIPDGTVYFLSRDGVWKYHHSMPKAESVSREKMPKQLLNVVQSPLYHTTMEYDVRFRGIYINVAKLDTPGDSPA
ncbi:MAG: hypothetical protein ACYSWU_02160, partial [Planctomycetota bacterium]